MRNEPTRHLTCKRCSTEFDHVGRGRCWYCQSCRKEVDREKAIRYGVAHGIIKNPGVGSGGAQFLENNHQWKDGRIAYKRLARQAGCACALCGAVDVSRKMCAHHINQDRSDNRVENLRLVCKRCHQMVEHSRPRDKAGRFIAEVKSRKISGTPSNGQSDLKATSNVVSRGND
jgi:hypothetical protein